MFVDDEKVHKFAEEFACPQEVIRTVAKVYKLPPDEFEETLKAVKRAAPMLSKLENVKFAFERKKRVLEAVERAAHLADHVIWHLLTKMFDVWSCSFSLNGGKVRVVYEIPENVNLLNCLAELERNFQCFIDKKLETEKIHSDEVWEALHLCSNKSYEDFARSYIVSQLYPGLKYSPALLSESWEKRVDVEFLVIGKKGDPDYICCPHKGEVWNLPRFNEDFDIKFVSVKRKGSGRPGMQKAELRFSVWTKDKHGHNLFVLASAGWLEEILNEIF